MEQDFDQIFEEIESLSYKNPNENYFDVLKESNRPLVLYGAGENCGYAMYLCSVMNISIDCLCDREKRGVHEYNRSKCSIISPQELVGNLLNAFILISPWKFETAIKNDLISIGFPANQIVYL